VSSEDAGRKINRLKPIASHTRTKFDRITVPAQSCSPPRLLCGYVAVLYDGFPDLCLPKLTHPPVRAIVLHRGPLPLLCGVLFLHGPHAWWVQCTHSIGWCTKGSLHIQSYAIMQKLCESMLANRHVCACACTHTCMLLLGCIGMVFLLFAKLWIFQGRY